MNLLRLMLFTMMMFTCLLCNAQANVDERKMLVDSAINLQKIPTGGETYLLDENDHIFIPLSQRTRSNFHYMDIASKQNRKKLKKGISAWKVFSYLHGNELVVKIVDFSITYKNKNYDFGNNGGAIVEFFYDCNDNSWLLKNSKWYGN